MERIKILVADSHPVFREGLCRLLKDEIDLEIVGTAKDGDEAVRLTNELLPDVAIIDVAIPKVSGIEVAKQIKSSCPTTAVLMVSDSYRAYINAALRAGVAGYIFKNAPVNELISAIRLVHCGEGVFDIKVVKRIAHRLAAEKAKENGELDELHRRELELLKLAAKGMHNKDIATHLVISERTVQSHLVNIFRKLGVHSRTQAILHALEEGWFTLDDLSEID